MGLLDLSRNFQPPLAFRLDIKELVYSFDRGTLNIKWLGGTDEQKSEQGGPKRYLKKLTLWFYWQGKESNEQSTDGGHV